MFQPKDHHMTQIAQAEQEKAKRFLLNDFPVMLFTLEADQTPLWGLMTPQHMVEHLIVTYKMAIGRIKLPVVSKEEDWSRIKGYFMKDGPMKRSVPSPTGKNNLQPLRSASLDEAREKLLQETAHFLAFVDEHPDFVANHPYGGPMTAVEWLLFNRKHIKHHFIQFGLMPDFEDRKD